MLSVNNMVWALLVVQNLVVDIQHTNKAHLRFELHTFIFCMYIYCLFLLGWTFVPRIHFMHYFSISTFSKFWAAVVSISNEFINFLLLFFFIPFINQVMSFAKSSYILCLIRGKIFWLFLECCVYAGYI